MVICTQKIGHVWLVPALVAMAFSCATAQEQPRAADAPIDRKAAAGAGARSATPGMSESVNESRPAEAAKSPATTSEAQTEQVEAVPSGPGVGDLLVAPTRIVFEGSKRTAEVALVNIGTAPATYRISLSHLRMTEEGGLEEYETPGPNDRIADKLVRFSPRQVTLEPQVVQTIRIQVRKPADLASGEYRSHVLFRAVPQPRSETGEPGDGLQIRLIPIYGVSIPLIVRHGDVRSTAKIVSVRTIPPAGAQDVPHARIEIERTGDASVYGDLRVTHVGAMGAEQVIGLVGGIAVYPEVLRRTFDVPLQIPTGTDLSSGRIRVVFREAAPGEGTIAETTADLR